MPTVSSASSSVGGTDTSKQNQKEVFYSPAGQDLIIARKSIFNFSLKKVQERLNNRKKLIDNPSLEIQDNRYVSTLYGACRDLALNSSQFGDDRPLSCVRYAPNGRTVATGSLSCYIKLWDVSDLGCVDTLRGHVERITAVAWNPESQSLSQGE
jgi:U4/U6 small nuclear ribonucleoprotein PRP4